MKKKRILGLILATTMLFSATAIGCGTGKKTASGGKNYPKKPLEFIAPGGAGGGWDLTIRTVAKVLNDTKLVGAAMPITNKPGGGGAVNLSYMQAQKGSDKLISVYSPPLLLSNLNGSTQYSYKNTTPIAKLITDYAVFVVHKDSKYKTIKDVMEALKKNPKSVKVGGNSSVGSMDHIQFLIVAKAAGVKNLKDIDYVGFQDGGASAQILGGHVDLLSTGLGDVEQLVTSGQLRALAQTSEKRTGEGAISKIPTCKEEGIDATFENWRGLFGAPEMPNYAVGFWEETLEKMVKTQQWKDACKKNGWDESFEGKEEFTKFLEKQNEVYKGILKDIGMLK